MNQQESTRRPNVIWILGDQHRGQATGYMGDPNVHTPNLDRLASEGVVFTRAVAGCPLCCPFRGSMLTSRYPHECVPGHEYRMPADQPTIAQTLKANGYHTAYFGKWHVDGHHERDYRGAMHIVPPERRGGFDEWIGYENNNCQWDTWVHGGQGDSAVHYRLPGYETDCLTDLLTDYIKRRAQDAPDDPFFAVLSVQPPHDPYVAPPEWMARHTPANVQLRPNVPDVPWVVDRARRDLAGAYAMIENLDFNVGRVRDTLAQTALEFDTHIVFFSDHGDMHGSHGQFHKTTPWQESINMPFVIGGAHPRYGYKRGRHVEPINHVDIAPTTLGLCGIDVPDTMRGTDYSWLRIPDRPQTELPDSAFGQLVVPTGHGDSVDRPWRTLITRDGWSYSALEGQPWLMFNLNDDPYELVNVAHNTRFRHERKRLNDRLAQWIADTGDRFDLPAV